MVATASSPEYARLINPSPLLSIFSPDDNKMKLVARYLMEGRLNLSDEYRNYDYVYRMLYAYMQDPCSVFYEVGNMQALLGMTGMVPHFKCNVMFKLFDPKLWGVTFAREVKDFFKLFMDVMHLKRLSTESPDPRIVKMAMIAGFKYEGDRHNDFLWDGKYYINHLLGITEITERPTKSEKKKKKRRK